MRRLRNGGDVDGASAVRLATTAGRGDRAAPRGQAQGQAQGPDQGQGQGRGQGRGQGQGRG